MTSKRDPVISHKNDPQNELSSLYDEDLMTPFAGNPVSSMLCGGVIGHESNMDIKPFKNVIKRYWTEEEVRCVVLNLI